MHWSFETHCYSFWTYGGYPLKSPKLWIINRTYLILILHDLAYISLLFSKHFMWKVYTTTTFTSLALRDRLISRSVQRPSLGTWARISSNNPFWILRKCRGENYWIVGAHIILPIEQQDYACGTNWHNQLDSTDGQNAGKDGKCSSIRVYLLIWPFWNIFKFSSQTTVCTGTSYRHHDWNYSR